MSSQEMCPGVPQSNPPEKGQSSDSQAFADRVVKSINELPLEHRVQAAIFTIQALNTDIADTSGLGEWFNETLSAIDAVNKLIPEGTAFEPFGDSSSWNNLSQTPKLD